MNTLRFIFLITCSFLLSIPTKAKADIHESLSRKDKGLVPILRGDYADPSIMRDGNDYYMTHSSFDYLPGLTVLHSTDLVHWTPISYVLKERLGSVWAPDITKHDDKYYIYFTVAGKPAGGNYVVWANSPAGPWSKPINLHVSHIDPGHTVGEDGTHWLFLSGGHRVKLTDDGLATDGKVEKVYDGWTFPEDWIVTGFGLEAPKVKRIGDYYYLMCAQGGTMGPPTAHMSMLARSKSINGPWENSPYNPIVHTWKYEEKWWNKGHGSLIDTPQGNWYIVYHAYEKNYVNLGRQTIIEPVEQTADGWFVLKEGMDPLDKEMKKLALTPMKEYSMHKHLSEFRVGKEWRFCQAIDFNRFTNGNHSITIKAKGDRPHDSSPLLFVAGCHSYELEAEIELGEKTIAGLVIWYNNVHMVGCGISRQHRWSYRREGISRRGSHPATHRVWLRLKNDRNSVSGSYSLDGKTWKRDIWGMEVSGFDNNTLGGFMSILPGIFVCGEGEATFRNFKFTPIDN